MNRRSHSIHRQIPVWWLATLPLLLAALLASSQLDDFAFNRDEPDSLLAAGIYDSGPNSLAATWQFIEESDPHQSQGWAMLLFLWGRVAGWSEPAIRSLSVFAGILALAWIYRTGRDLFSPQPGLLAALLMSASAFFLSYMLIARAFTPVALFTTMIVWSYWRLAIARRKSGPGAAAILLTGCVGLPYSHYFGSLFLPALGLFHLLFVPKNRRWWLPVLLFAIASAIALLQAPGLLNGLEKHGPVQL